APDWNPQAKGMICNLSLCSKRGDIARALLEGIAVDVARNLEMIEKAVGQAQVLCLSGGLTNLPAFNQLQADIYNRCTVICSNNEATSAGAWISWMKQTGRCESYEQAFVLAQKTSSETTYWPCEKTATAYQALKLQSRVLYERLWQ
ncbi:MAG: FGGY-family carbohydrate kinase, partial [Ruthenibacterium sp.]